MQLQTHFYLVYLQNQQHRLDHVRTTSRLSKYDYHYILDKKLNNQMLHKKLICCNVFLHLSFVQPNCSKIKKISAKRKFHIYYNVFCAEDAARPPPIQQASKCEPCQILIVAGKWIMGAGRLNVPMAMGRVPLSWQ